GVDGRDYSLADFNEKKVVVVMFTCNHCPYVQAYEGRLIAIQRDFSERGVALVAINANETKNYPEDDFQKMVLRAKKKGYNFPYLRDETQEIADAYGAHYTPEVFLLGEERRLQYTGRIDDNWDHPESARSHDLRNAIEAVLSGKTVESPETHAIGCTIKWAQSF
ncbi:MAG: thioredoxin family protein, partial [Nitrospiria bacterium]